MSFVISLHISSIKKIYKHSLMKTKLFPYALFFIIIAVSAIFVIQGCKKSVSPFDPSTATYMYNMRGQVVDAKSNSGIPAATVKIFDNVITTDVNGYFTFKVSYATSFPFIIYAEAPNYILGNSLISGPAQVRAVRLTMENPGVILNETGGSLVAQSTESVSGQPHTLTVPAGSLAQSVSMSFTSMEDFYYMYDPDASKTTSMIDLATVSLAPYDQLFLKPVSLYIPLPFYNNKDTQIPVFRFNQSTNTWINTGKFLLVDESKTGGRVEIIQGGIYSVAGEGTYTEELVSQSFLSEYSCQGDSPLIWQALIDHPQGTPANVSATWLKNTVSHNSVIGGHVSFLKTTSTAVVCEPYQPGSTYPVPSDEININGNPYPCPSGTNPIFLNKGVTINNRVINTVLTFVSNTDGPQTTVVSSTETVRVPIQGYEYWCPHDQGGGK